MWVQHSSSHPILRAFAYEDWEPLYQSERRLYFRASVIQASRVHFRWAGFLGVRASSALSGLLDRRAWTIFSSFSSGRFSIELKQRSVRMVARVVRVMSSPVGEYTRNLSPWRILRLRSWRVTLRLVVSEYNFRFG